MADYRLVKGKKNEVFRAVVDEGLRPTDFEWTEEIGYYAGLSSPLISVLRFLPSGSDDLFFAFDIQADMTSLMSRMSPGLDRRVETYNTRAWPTQLTYVGKWLNLIKKESDEPDLWATIESEKALAVAASSPDSDAAPFTPEEQARITENLAEIKNYLMTIVDLGREQQAFVDDRLKYLAEASTRLGRKDWITMFYGGFVSIVVGLALRGDNAADLMRFAGQIFHWLVKTQYFFPATGT